MRMLLLKAWRDIKSRKGQFLSLAALVSIGIMSYVAFITGYLDLKASLDRANSELRFASFNTRVVSAPESVARRIAALPGVDAVEARLVVDTGLDMPDGGQVTARVVGIPLDRTPSVNRLVMQEGRLPKPRERNAVVLNKKFTNETGIGVGDTLDVHTGAQTKTRLRIVGIGSSPEYFYPIRAKGEIPSPGEFAVFFMEQRQAGALFGRSGGVNDVAVLISSSADLDRVIDDVEAKLDPFVVLESVPQADQPSNFGLQEEVEQNRAMADFMPGLVLVISSLSLFIALSRLVQSQRGEIGLMKALGYTDVQVLGHYLAFSLIIAVGGSILGILLGIWAAVGIADLYVTLLGIPLLTTHVYPLVLLNAVLMSSIACVLAGIVPAWAAVRIPPAKAMHSDPNLAVKGGGRIPIVERLFGWAMPRSFTFRIPLRNVFRARRRSLYTVVGIAFAMVLTVATWSMFDAVDFMMTKVFQDTEKWDIVAAYEGRFGSDRVVEVSRWKGVDRVDPALTLPVELSKNGVEHTAMLTAMAPTAAFHGFDITDGEESERTLSSGEMVMAEAVAKKLGVTVGDTVKVKSPYMKERQTLTVGAISDETLGGPVFVSVDVGRVLTNTSRNEYNVLYIFSSGGREERIKEELYDLPGATQVQVKDTLLEKLMSLMEFATTFGAIMLAFGFAMAAAVIYNTFTANILERTREIATMRTIGEENGRLAVMVTIENVLLALAAVPLGVWLGLRASDALYASFSTEAYSFKSVIYPQSIAWIVGINLLVLLVSEIPPVRRIFRLDLAEATKVME